LSSQKLIFLSVIITFFVGLLIINTDVQAGDSSFDWDIKQVITLWADPAIPESAIIDGIEYYISIGVIETANAQDIFEAENTRMGVLEDENKKLQGEIDQLRSDFTDHLANEQSGPDILALIKPDLNNFINQKLHLVSFGGDTVNPIFDDKVYIKQIQETSISTYHRQSCDDGDYVLAGGGYVRDGNYLRESRPADVHTWFIAGSNINGEPVPVYNFTILCLDVKTEGFSGEMAP